MRSTVPLALAAIGLCVSFAPADVISIQSSRDNTLIESPTGAFSNGAGPSFFVGTITAGTLRRGLVYFDLAAIPAGSTITAVSLTLNCSQAQGPEVDVSLHRTLADWGEGTSFSTGGGGAPSTPGDATWIHTFFNTEFWSNPGGDFVAASSAAQAVSGTGQYTWASTPDLVADAQGWLDDPSSNFGWTVLGLETSAGNAKRFDSRENAMIDNRPVLNVEYVVPAPAAAAPLGMLVLIAFRRHRR